jgi:S-adenosylmethionine/arginine decarboxylase-like enzyme
LREATATPEVLSRAIIGLVEESGLAVIGETSSRFPDGGMTMVWILAESHLVLHYWAEEGFSTLDLHVCDYQRSNADKAARLKDSLEDFCFEPGTGSWRELAIEDPQPHEISRVGAPQ